MSTQQQQEVIDQLIDYIDKAILKNSVSNRHVAAVLAFLNEALKDKSIDLEELKKYFLSKTEPDGTPYLLKLLGGAEVGETIDSLTAGKGILLKNGRVQTDILEARFGIIVQEIIFNRLSAMESLSLIHI